MRWWVFAIFALVMLALEVGLRNLLAFPDASGPSPSFLLILLVFVALHAPPRAIGWASLALGLLADLSPPDAVIGPATVAFLLAGQLLVLARGMVFRDSVISVVILTFVAGLFAGVVWTALLWFRSLPFIGGTLPAGGAGAELLGRFYQALYTALAAALVGWVLERMRPLWAFAATAGARPLA